MSIRQFAAAALSGAALLGAAPPAAAYNVYEYAPGEAARWSGNAVGTPGGVVTWSLMPDGTGLASAAPSYVHGNSQLGGLFTLIDNAYGTGTALNLIRGAFGFWQSVANIQFVELTESGSVPFAAEYSAVGTAVIGDIRIGAFAIDGFSGAVGFTAPPNGGTTLEGDILFNVGVAYQVAAGAEGDPFYLYPWPSPTAPGDRDGWYHNDWQALFAHELGHALGLAHTDVTTALMCGDGAACAYFGDNDGLAPITRMPRADDIAGIQYLYAAPVPEPGGLALWLAGLAVLGAVARRRL